MVEVGQHKANVWKTLVMLTSEKSDTNTTRDASTPNLKTEEAPAKHPEFDESVRRLLEEQSGDVISQATIEHAQRTGAWSVWCLAVDMATDMLENELGGLARTAIYGDNPSQFRSLRADRMRFLVQAREKVRERFGCQSC